MAHAWQRSILLRAPLRPLLFLAAFCQASAASLLEQARASRQAGGTGDDRGQGRRDARCRALPSPLISDLFSAC